MKAKSIIKIVLDIVMAGLFVALLAAHRTGLVFHEIMGLFIALLFAAHLALNWKWIVGITKQILAKKAKRKPILMYVLNTGLLVGAAIVIATGVMISVELFSWGAYNPVLVALHRYGSYFMAGLLAVHMALHMKYFITMCKKIARSIRTPVTLKVLSGTAAALMIVALVYSSIASALEGRLHITSPYEPSSLYEETRLVTGVSEITSSENITASTATTENATTLATITTTAGRSNRRREDLEEEETTTSTTTTSSTTTSEPAEEAISLSEFLSKMFCNLCSRRCPLSHPQCRKSADLIQKATVEYNMLYSAQ